MSLKLNSSGGGSVTLQEPTTSSARTLSLPDVTGTVITTADSGTVTPTMLSQKLTLATAQNTTSGTSIDFTGIPSWVRRITVMFADVSTNGSSIPLLQLGTSGGIETTGYLGAVSNVFNGGSPQTTQSTAGFMLNNSPAASAILHGILTIGCLNASSNLWVFAGNLVTSDSPRSELSGGRKTLSGTLDRIRLTTVNGTDTFDAGSVNIMYEG